MKAALIACLVFWLILAAWIIHDVSATCGRDMFCRVQMEAP